jgi:acetate kinase
VIILVLNCGSSSVKYCLYRGEEEPEELARGSIERVGLADSEIVFETKGKPRLRRERGIANHEKAMQVILNELVTEPEHGCIQNLEAIEAVGHRVVHGGEHFSQAVRIDDDVKRAIEECARFAPLHNPSNLKGIEACERLLPDVPQVAVFDTAFHSTLPPEAYLYAIPYKLYKEQGIRRYGFHGTSHAYVAEQADRLLRELGLYQEPSRLVTCHLGSGASLSAVKGGQCIDTSMGFTPLEGLVMGTRCGDLDPAVVLYLLYEYGPNRLDRMLNKESGLKGLTGFSDMRDVMDAADGKLPEGATELTKEQRDMAQVAMNLYAHRVKRYIGAFAAVLGGLDAVVMTAGVGEHAPKIRALTLDGLQGMGIYYDPEKNARNEAVISTEDSPVATFVIHTNEELVIARDTMRVVTEEVV